MSRVKIYFRGYASRNIQRNFDDYMSYLFHEKVNELFMGTDYEDFKFFTFSGFHIEKGIINFVVSSVSDEFLRMMVSAFVMGENIIFNKSKLELVKAEFLPRKIHGSDEASFITASPIFLADCIVMDNLGDILEDLLIDNFCEYFNRERGHLHCDFYSRHDHYGTYSEESGDFRNYYYNIDIVMKGSPELIAFAYDVGLGNNNNQGFGMLDIY